MNIRIKITFDPMTTLMKIPTTSDDDTASLLLLLSITTQSDALPRQLQQQRCKKSKLARSGNGSTSNAVMDIFLVSQDSIHLEGQQKLSLQICVCGICGMQWTRCTSLHQRQGRGWQLISWNHQKKAKSQTASLRQWPSSHNGIDLANSWVPSTNKHVMKQAEKMQTDYPVSWDETFWHRCIPGKMMIPG